MKSDRRREANCDDGKEDMALAAIIEQPGAADTGERFTLAQVAAQAGIDLDEL